MITAVSWAGRSCSGSEIPHQPLSDSRRLTIEDPGALFYGARVSRLIMSPGPGRLAA